METLTIPYHRSIPTAVVVWAADVEIELHPEWMHVKMDSLEEVPKNMDDLMLGTKERKREGRSLIMRKAITAIETSYDGDTECYDIRIYTARDMWGYNVRTCSEGVALYLKLAAWLTQ